MSMSGTTGSSTAIDVNLDLTREVDPHRFTRLANLLFSPSTILGSTVGVST
jgi:hypothetical protein